MRGLLGIIHTPYRQNSLFLLSVLRTNRVIHLQRYINFYFLLPLIFLPPLSLPSAFQLHHHFPT